MAEIEVYRTPEWPFLVQKRLEEDSWQTLAGESVERWEAVDSAPDSATAMWKAQMLREDDTLGVYRVIQVTDVPWEE